MSNFSVGGDFRIAAATSEPTLTSAPGVTSSAQKSVGALYPRLSPNVAASSLAQLKNTPVILIKQRGDDVMQQVQPKGDPAPGGYQPNSVSDACNSGKLAYAGDSAGQILGGALGPNGKVLGGKIGREIGGIGCEIDDAFFTPVGPEPEKAPEEGGMTMAPAGPGIEGGFSLDPASGGSSSKGSYIDPATGEQITNKDGKIIAGDPNADPGTDIGEVDDPDFTKNQSMPSDNSSEKSSEKNQSTTTDNTTQEPTQPEDTTATGTTDPGPKPDDMPADDGSGSNGPAGPRSYIYGSSAEVSMPADDSASGGTPRSNVVSVAHAAASPALFNVALSRSQLT